MLVTQRKTGAGLLGALSFLLLCTFAQMPVCGAHGGLGVNICARDERPMSASSKRLSCKQDPQCIHETQCGCIPKDCTCGNERCIFAGPGNEGDAHDAHDAPMNDAHEAHDGELHSHADGTGHGHPGGDLPHHHGKDGAIILEGGTDDDGAASEDGASKHHLVDDDSDGPTHTHANGTAHGHPGGDLPHHHDKDGAIVFDLPKKPAKLVMNKGKLLLKPATVQAEAKDDDDAVDADSMREEPAQSPADGKAARPGTTDVKSDSSAWSSAAPAERADKAPVNGSATQDSLPTREPRQARAPSQLRVGQARPPSQLGVRSTHHRAQRLTGCPVCVFCVHFAALTETLCARTRVRALTRHHVGVDAAIGFFRVIDVAGAGYWRAGDRGVLRVLRVCRLSLLQAQGAGQEHALQGHVQRQGNDVHGLGGQDECRRLET
jgi:hypothetical protein